MVFKFRRITNAAALFALVAASLLSNEAGAAAAKRRARPAAAAHAPKPLDILAGQLALNSQVGDEGLGNTCNRANFKNLAIALNMNAALLTSEKSEFETSEEYAGRRDKLAKAVEPFHVVICQWLNDNPDVNFNYSADNEKFIGGFQRTHNVWRDTKRLGSFRTKTRMGIPMTVTASADMEYNLSVELPSELKGCLAGSNSGFTFEAPANRTVAPTIKARSRLVMLGTLIDPYIAKGEQHETASLDDPYEVHTYSLTAHLKPDRIAVVGASGDVVWSCVPGKFNPSPKPILIRDSLNWVANDYPSRALRENRSGRVQAILSVAIDGTVSDCRVTISSGSQDLDNATCASFRRRARFTPAADNEGNPMPGEYTQTMNWKPPF